MNLLPTAIDLLVDRPNGDRPVGHQTTSRANTGRPARAARVGRQPQLPLALPLTKGAGSPDARRGRRPSALTTPPTPVPAPALDVIAAARALLTTMGAAGDIVRLSTPAEGWPDAFVAPGDAVLIAAGGRVDEGALAAVRIRATGSVLLRRVHRSGEHVRLQPEDRTVLPMLVPAESVELMGPVVTLLRRPAGVPSAVRRTA